MDQESLLESVIGELIGTVKGAKDGISEFTRDSKKVATIALGLDKIESVTTRVKKSILYFPVFVSNSVSPKYALDIAKGHQIKLAEYIRIILANENVLDIDDNESESDVKYKLIDRMRGGVDIYSQEYTEENAITINIDYDELSETVKKAIDERKIFLESNELYALVKYPDFSSEMDKLTRDSINYGQYLTEMRWRNGPNGPEINPDDADIDSNTRGRDLTPFQREALDRAREEREARRDANARAAERNFTRQRDYESNLQRMEAETRRRDFDREENRYGRDHQSREKRLDRENSSSEKRLDRAHTSREKNLDRTEKEKDRRASAEQNRLNRDAQAARDQDKFQFQSQQSEIDRRWREEQETKRMNYDLANNSKMRVEWSEGLDIKKINNFAPVVIKVTVIPKSTKAYHGGGDIELLVGVKTFVHPLESDQLIEGVGRALRKNGIFLQIARTITGELNFITEFLFDMSNQRDRYNASNSKTTSVLEKLRAESERSVRMLSTTGGKVLPPTSTIMISMDDCERIKRLYGVELLRKKIIKQIMGSHNLVSFIIVDEATSIVHTYDDGDDDYKQTVLEDYRPKAANDSINSMLDAFARGR